MIRSRWLPAVFTPIALAISTPMLFGQIAPSTPARPAALTPRDLSKTRAEFLKVRDRMESVQREFDRAARGNLPDVRDAALKDWSRALEGLEPYVKELSPDVADEKTLLDQYHQWRELYDEAADLGLAGQFTLQTAKLWADLTAGTEGWEQEKATADFNALVKADANDENARSLGMPKTVAFIKAANTYLTTVVARPDYDRFKLTPNVKKDIDRTMVTRTRAQTAYATAANSVLMQAGSEGALDQAGRDRLERFVEDDLSQSLANFDGMRDLQTRGRLLVYNFDKRTIGDAAANEKSKARLTAAAEKNWPLILAHYATKPMAPVESGRGQIVRIDNAKNLIGKQFGVDNYDFADYVGGAPVVGNFAPGVKAYLQSIYPQTGLKQLPDDTVYDIVAVLRGTAQVPNVKQRPGATTAPVTADAATATTSPAVTSCVLIEIVAVKAGPPRWALMSSRRPNGEKKEFREKEVRCPFAGKVLRR